MKASTKKIIAGFEKENRQLWGDKFFIIVKSNKVILMTEGLVKKLREIVDDLEIEITSLDKDESVGQYFRVKNNSITHIHHYHREPKEIARSLENLPSKDMITIEDEDGRMVIKNELMNGELFRGVVFGNWIAAAAYHDFVNIAPKVIGWIKLDNRVELVRTKQLTRPDKFSSLEELVTKLINLPYHLGGKSIDKGFDCSSMVQWIVYHTKGIWMPKLAKWQVLVGDQVEAENCREGDLIFFEKSPSWSVEHVGIVYGGNGSLIKMLHAYSGRRKIIIDEVDNYLQGMDKGKIKINSIRRINLV